MRLFARSMVRLVAVFASLGLAFVAGACADEEVPLVAKPASTAETAATFPLTLKDSTGTEVRLEKMPQRLISLSPGATEILYAIGAGDRVVATDRFSDYPEAANATPKIDYSNPNPEATLSFRPDLVIMATRQEQLVAQFRGLGMTVYLAKEPEDLDGVYRQIGTFGQLTGRSAEANRLVADMRREVDAVIASIAGVTQGPRVFFELDSTLYTAAPNTFIGAMLTMLKARNVAEGATTQFPQLSAEAVIAANPEVILLADHAFGQNLETVSARPGWGGVAAVVNKRVHPIDPNTTNRPGPRLAQGIRALGQALYPDRVK
jgi:iron complex transport system substrate-binding protein